MVAVSTELGAQPPMPGMAGITDRVGIAGMASGKPASAGLQPTPPVPLTELSQLSQGVECGEFNLAFSFDWARQIVEQFEMVPIPRAPVWVLGAVNVNGVIIAVVDLANYFSKATVPAQLSRGQRLLVGGIEGEDAEGALAIVFSQSPSQLDGRAAPSFDLAVLPPRLQEVCSAALDNGDGKTYVQVNTSQLMDALAAELSVI